MSICLGENINGALKFENQEPKFNFKYKKQYNDTTTNNNNNGVVVVVVGLSLIHI